MKIKWEHFRLKANISHLTEEQKWQLYKKLLEEEEAEYQMALLRNDARNNFLQSLGLTSFAYGSAAVGGTGGSGAATNIDPDFFFPPGMDRYLAAGDQGILLGSIDPGPTPVFITAISKSQISDIEITGTNGNRIVKIKGIPGGYDTLMEVDEINGSANNYANVYKEDLLPYVSPDY